MKPIIVGGSALNQTPLAWDNNQANILAAIDKAREKGVQILCLPELCITAYDCMDAFYRPEVLEQAWASLMGILPHTQDIGVAIGLPISFEGHTYNAVAWVVDGVIQGFACKSHLADTGVYYEYRWFKPWVGEPKTLHKDGLDYPVGQRLFESFGKRIGFEICEEAWVDKRIAHDLAQDGVHIILNPSASIFTFDKLFIRRQLVSDICEQYPVTYVFANQLGNAEGRLIYDGQVIIGEGDHLKEGPYLSFNQNLVTIGNSLSQPSRHDQLSKAIALALWDTLIKTKTQGFVISLSGGVDSTACAMAVWLMLHFAEADLGLDGIKKRLGHIAAVQNAPSISEMMPHLLTTVYQKTAQNSVRTEDMAALLASHIGATHHVIDVEPLFQCYQDTLSSIVGHLSWDRDDVPLQNLQARVRAPGVWLIANLKKSLLLATSNRSEAAVGYTTMDGDTAGSFSPLAGLDKPFLQEWLAYLQLQYNAPILGDILAQPPTAELRPLYQTQTDEVDLMPYPVLNLIETTLRQSHIADKDILKGRIKKKFPEYTSEQREEWVSRFLRLWQASQWKRERLAPSFQFDTHSLCSKTDCRMPIFSGD